MPLTSPLSLTNQLALITGATRGIGRAIALALGAQGATIIATATTPTGAQHITDYLTTANIPGTGHVLDVTDDASVTQCLSTITKTFSPPTILINNAGITRDALLLRMKETDWDIIMDTNLKSVYRLSKTCLRGMTRARHGRIINISSIVATTGNPGQTSYAATKAGLLGFTKSLALEVASRNITVNAVSPGFIDTDMTRALTASQRAALHARIPLSRLGTPEDIAAAVVFLASPMAAYITGITLPVNGGMLMP